MFSRFSSAPSILRRGDGLLWHAGYDRRQVKFVNERGSTIREERCPVLEEAVEETHDLARRLGPVGQQLLADAPAFRLRCEKSISSFHVQISRGL